MCHAIRTLFLFLVATTLVSAQVDVSSVSVSTALLKKHVFTLASDSLQGRATGMAGQLKAALYSTQAFRQSHLLPVFQLDSIRGSFYQPYTFRIFDVSVFGQIRTNGFPTYKRHELTPLSTKNNDSTRVFVGHNVAGLLIGTDLKREVVIVSAHYDHLGYSGNRVFHGADDNASGTAAVLSIAAVVDSLAQQGIRPRRSILFVLFSGEEGGLLGSEYFIQNSPVPLKQLICDVNIDMVGRVDYAHRKRPDYCYLLMGVQPDNLFREIDVANRKSVNLALNQGGYDTKNDPEQYFYRSDQYTFFKQKIPVLFFTSGEHADYHQPSDTANKINYDALQKRATLVFQTVWLVANR